MVGALTAGGVFAASTCGLASAGPNWGDNLTGFVGTFYYNAFPGIIRGEQVE